MERIFYCLVLGLFILSCDNSDEDHAITDFEGLSLDLSWDETGVENADSIGLVLYDPQGVLLYQGQDSVAIFNYLVDGQYVIAQLTVLQLCKIENYRVRFKDISLASTGSR